MKTAEEQKKTLSDEEHYAIDHISNKLYLLLNQEFAKLPDNLQQLDLKFYIIQSLFLFTMITSSDNPRVIAKTFSKNIESMLSNIAINS